MQYSPHVAISDGCSNHDFGCVLRLIGLPKILADFHRGGLTTIVAGYLARTRGSNEPETSKARVKELDKFIREAKAFVLDFGQYDDPMYDDQVAYFRSEFEELLGAGTA